MPPLSPRTWLACALVVGCSGHHGPPSAVEGQRDLLAAALARPVPSHVQAKVTVKATSPLLGIAGSTGGALFVSRPGRGHLAVFGPLGGPVLTAQTDGVGLAVTLMRDRRHLLAEDAEAVLRTTTGDQLGVDDLLSLLEGRLPFGADEVVDSLRQDDGDLRVTLKGPKGTSTVVVLDDATGTPVSLAALARNGDPLLSADYAPFAPMDGTGPLLPTEVRLEVPALELVLELKARSWTVPDEMPDVFGLASPEGFTTGPLESLVPLGSPARPR